MAMEGKIVDRILLYSFSVVGTLQSCNGPTDRNNLLDTSYGC